MLRKALTRRPPLTVTQPNPPPQTMPPLGALAAGFGLLGASAFAQAQAPAASAAAASPAATGARNETTLQPTSVKARPEADATSVRARTTTLGKGQQALRDR